MLNGEYFIILHWKLKVNSFDVFHKYQFDVISRSGGTCCWIAGTASISFLALLWTSFTLLAYILNLRVDWEGMLLLQSFVYRFSQVISFHLAL